MQSSLQNLMLLTVKEIKPMSGNAFKVDLAVELKKDIEDQLFPIFVSQKENVKSYILPVGGLDFGVLFGVTLH